MIRIVKLVLKEEYIESFELLFEERKKTIREMQGCNHLALWQDESDKRIFFTYSKWDNQHHLDLYRFSSFFKNTWTTIKPWFDGKPEAWSVSEKSLQL
jgi:quinol monooxygenase YgiN